MIFKNIKFLMIKIYKYILMIKLIFNMNTMNIQIVIKIQKFKKIMKIHGIMKIQRIKNIFTIFHYNMVIMKVMVNK